MKRRCAFLDQLPAFNYNTGVGEYFNDPATGKRVASDTRELGSTLMSTMLQEVMDFCNPEIKENWSLKAHQQVEHLCSSLYQFSLLSLSLSCFLPPLSLSLVAQLIYDFKDGGGSFGLLSLLPDRLPKQEKAKFEKIRVIMPSMMQVHI